MNTDTRPVEPMRAEDMPGPGWLRWRMTPAERRTECRYRYEERLAILRDDGEPTVTEIHYARMAAWEMKHKIELYFI